MLSDVVDVDEFVMTMAESMASTLTTRLMRISRESGREPTSEAVPMPPLLRKDTISVMVEELAKNTSMVILMLELQPAIDLLTDGGRLALFEKITKGYCRGCGGKLDGPCHCQNDE